MKADGRLLISSAGILYGSVTIGGNLFSRAGLSAFDISFFFLAFSLIPLAPLAIKRDFFFRIRRSSRYLAVYALANSGLILLQFESLALGLAPAISALLLYTQPIWTVIFGRVLFSEKVDRARVGIIILALSGVLLIANPFDIAREFSARPSSFYGELAALAGGVFLSIWIILGKKGRSDAFENPAELAFAVRGTTLVFVSLISLATIATGENLFFARPETIEADLLPLFAFSIIAGSIPDYLFYAGIEKIQSLQAGVMLLLEPVSAAVLSVTLRISTPGLLVVLGGGLILLSNYVANTRNDPVPAAQKRAGG
ncbi:MAG: DMT family transporter [Nitrososphaerales archaeon]